MRCWIAIATIIFFVSCSKVKLITTTSPTVSETEKGYIFENDTVRVKYDMWAKRGVLHFEITNKTNKPLYFDWKKSAFLPKNVMMSYWQDETNTVSTSASTSFYYRVPISTSKSVRKERIGIVPPKAMITNSLYIIAPGKGTEFKLGQYNAANTPLFFRNYLAMSFDEDFKTGEFYIDNEFYIKSIEAVKDSKKDKYKSGNKFFIPVF